MKKVLTNLAVVLCFFMLAACGSESASPTETIDNFIKYSMDGDAENAYKLLDKNTVANTKFEDYEKVTKTVAGNPVTKAFMKEFSYTINKVKEDGDKATAKVEQTLPDFAKILPAIPAIAKKNPNVKNEEDMLKAVKEHFNGELPLTKQVVDYTLVKEDGVWKVIPPQFIKQ